jgi:tRNA_anti-like
MIQNLNAYLLAIPLILVASTAMSQTAKDVYQNFEIDASPSARRGAEDLARNTDFCGVKAMDDLLDEVDRLLKKGDGIGAERQGLVLTLRASSCALALRKLGVLENPGTFAYFAGEGLSVLASRQTAERSRLYLGYAVQVGVGNKRAESNLAALKALEKPVVGTPTTTDMSLKAKDLVSQLRANQLRFWNTYAGKSLSITGVVSSITGDSKVAHIRLDGRREGLSKDDAKFSDYVDCSVQKEDQISKASMLDKGKEATIIGVATKGVMGEVELSGCAIR